MDAATQASIDKLNASVATQTTVEKSVETLLNGLAAQIAALKNSLPGGTDPAVVTALDAATAIITANNTAAQAAVVANTPGA